MRTVLLLLVLPLVFVGPSLLAGRHCLPILPAAYAPLAIEDPLAARSSRDHADWPAAAAGLEQLADDVAAHAAWSRGSPPTWDPLAGLGRPLAATSARGVWYPPNALAWIFDPGVAAGITALLALFLAGAGMRAFLRERALGAVAAWAGAWAFQAGGFALVHLHVPAHVDAALWLPFALFGIERALGGVDAARRTLGGLACAGSIALSFLAGSAPIAIGVTAAAVVYALVRALEVRRVTRAAMAGGWIALGILAAAVAWLPSIDRARAFGGAGFDRAAFGAPQAAAQDLPLATLATLGVPDLFGEPGVAVPAAHDPVAWWLTGAGDTTSASRADAIGWSLFAGVTVLLLAIAGAAGRPRAGAFAVALVLFALLFALGLPPASWLRHVPGLESATGAHAAGIAWTGWVILFAFGLGALLDDCRRARRTLLAAAAALVLAAGAAALVFDPADAARSLPASLAERHGVSLETVARVVPPEAMREGFARVQSGLVQLALIAVGALAAALSSRALVRRGARAACAPWLVLVAIEGVLLARAHVDPQPTLGRALFPGSVAMDAIADAAGGGRVVRCDDGHGVDGLAPPQILRCYGIRDLSADATDAAQSLLQLLATVDPQSLAAPGTITDRKVLELRALDLLRVTCVLSREPLSSPRLRPVWSQPGFCVQARSGAFPPARVAPPAAIVAAAEVAALQLVADRLHDPRRGVVIAAGDLPPESDRPQGSAGQFVPGGVEVSASAPDRLDARVTGSSGGWLVFHEQYAPGWKATVNGAGAPVVRADHVYRAVAIPPGDSVVRTQYEPGSLRLGAWISIVACAIAAVIGVRAARRPAA